MGSKLAIESMERAIVLISVFAYRKQDLCMTEQ